MANGLLAGIGAGLTAGTQSFQDARRLRAEQDRLADEKMRAQDELKLRRTSLSADLATKGLRLGENDELVKDESLKDPYAEQLKIEELEGKKLSNQKIRKELSDKGKGGLLISPEAIKAESDLRSELNKDPRTKALIEVDAAANAIKNASENPSPAGDISLLVGYMKLIDPGSTVREGEFATAQQAGGVPTQILATYNRMLRGERLTETQRQDFARQAASLYNARYEQFEPARQQITALAQQYGVNPERVVGSFSRMKRMDTGITREQALAELNRRRAAQQGGTKAAR